MEAFGRGTGTPPRVAHHLLMKRNRPVPHLLIRGVLWFSMIITSIQLDVYKNTSSLNPAQECKHAQHDVRCCRGGRARVAHMGRVLLGLLPDGPARARAVLHVRCHDDGGASRVPVHASVLGVAGVAAVAAVAASGSPASTSAAATITPKQQRAGANGNRLC